MKQEWILTEEQKQVKKAKILENRMKRASMEMPTSFDSIITSRYIGVSSTSAVSEKCQQVDETASLIDISDSSTLLSVAQSIVGQTGHNSSIDHQRSAMQYLDQSQSLVDQYIADAQFSPNFGTTNNSQSDSRSIKVYQRVIETNFTPIFLRDNRICPGSALSELERIKINELLEAFRMIESPVVTSTVSNEDELNLPFLAHITEFAVERLIQWSKKIQSFRTLCQDDQIALLKGGSIEMLLIKSSQTFNLDTDEWEVSSTTNSCNSGYKTFDFNELRTASGQKRIKEKNLSRQLRVTLAKTIRRTFSLVFVTLNTRLVRPFLLTLDFAKLLLS